MPPSRVDVQAENFDPAPNEELICSICRSVFKDPVECPCRHVFCRQCISLWICCHRNCPVCRKGVSHSTLQEVVPLVKNMIMKLTLRCQNFQNGCTAKPTYEMYPSHLNNCDFAFVECVNSGCNAKMLRKHVQEHEYEECAFRLISCSSCEMPVVLSSVEQHSCVAELHKMLREKDDKIAVLMKEKQSLAVELEEVKKKVKKENSSFSESSSSNSISSPNSDLRSFSIEPGVISSSLDSWSSDSEMTPMFENISDSEIESFADNSMTVPSVTNTCETQYPSVIIDSPDIESPNHTDLSSGAHNYSENDNYHAVSGFIGNGDKSVKSANGMQTRQGSMKRRRFSPSPQVHHEIFETVNKYLNERKQTFTGHQPKCLTNVADSISIHGGRNMSKEQRNDVNHHLPVDNTSSDVNLNSSSSNSVASTSHGVTARSAFIQSKNSKVSKSKPKLKRKNNLCQVKTPLKIDSKQVSCQVTAQQNLDNNFGNKSNVFVPSQKCTVELFDSDWEDEEISGSGSETSEWQHPMEEVPTKDDSDDDDQSSRVSQESGSAISTSSSSDSFGEFLHNILNKCYDENSEDDSNHMPPSPPSM